VALTAAERAFNSMCKSVVMATCRPKQQVGRRRRREEQRLQDTCVVHAPNTVLRGVDALARPAVLS